MFYAIIGISLFTGLAIGSFLNCAIWRLKAKEGIWGRSHCPLCGGLIGWRDNVPVFSFFWLRRKCRHCSGRIAWQYPAVEIVTGLLFVWAAYFHIKDIGFLETDLFLPLTYLFRDWTFIAVMVFLFVYDLRWYLIPDIISLPAIVFFFSFNIFLSHDWLNWLISGIIGGGFFLVQFLISKGKWIGGGDIRLGVLLGVFLGWPNIVLALLLAYFSGTLVLTPFVLAKKKEWDSQIPFGVFLSTGAIICLFFGNNIINWYLNLLY